MAFQKGSWHHWVEYAAMSDIGLRRESNQDAFGISLAPDPHTWRRQGHVFLVADGMGAHAAGELASKLAADGIPTLFFKYVELGPVEAMRRAFQETNSEVFRRGQANPEFHNMGTTATVMALVPEGALIGHVGDSRAYRLRGNQFVQWTRDHSVIWELRERSDVVRDEQLLAGIPRNWITRSIGPAESLEPDLVGPLPLEVGDTFLLCTDGLTSRVSDEEIAAVVGNYAPASAVKLLVDLANLRGGQDNITVIIVRMTEVPAEQPVQRTPRVSIGRQEEAQARRLPTEWITAAVLMLAAVVLFILQLFVAAAALLAGGAILAVWALFRWRRIFRSAVTPINRVSGPFVRVVAPDAAKSVRLLLNVARQVRTEARQTGWEEDIASLDEMENAVEQVLRERQLKEALDAIAGLLHELAERQRVFFKRYY